MVTTGITCESSMGFLSCKNAGFLDHRMGFATRFAGVSMKNGNGTGDIDENVIIN